MSFKLVTIIFFLWLHVSISYSKTNLITEENGAVIAKYAFKGIDNEKFEVIYEANCTYVKETLTTCEIKSATFLSGIQGEYISKSDCTVLFAEVPGHEWSMKKVKNKMLWEGRSKLSDGKTYVDENKMVIDWGSGSRRGTITANAVDLYDSKKRSFKSYSAEKCKSINVNL